jgi:outer membrane protein TolC
MALAGLVLLAWSAPASAERVTELTLTRRFLRRAPLEDLAIAERARRRAEALIPPYLPNPGLSFRREQSFGAGAAFATTVAGIGLRFEIGGRHGLKRRSAAAQAEALCAEQAARRLDEVCELRRLALASALAEDRTRLALAAQQRLEQLSSDLSALVRSGERAAFELRQMRLSASAHRRGLRRDQARLAAANAELSARTGLSVSGVVATTPAAPPALQGLLRASLKHPVLRALELHAQAAEVRVRLARRGWVPDLDLFGNYRRDEASGASGHGYEAGLGLTLPITDWGQRDRAVARAEGELSRAQLGVAAQRLAARIRALHREGTLLAGALEEEDPRELRTFHEEAVRRYRAGIAGLSSLLEALRTVETEELARAETLAQLRAIHLALACHAGRLPEAAQGAELRSLSR